MCARRDGESAGVAAAEALRREIADTFEARPHPGPDGITAPTTDETSEHWAVAQFLRDKSWHDVSEVAAFDGAALDVSGFLYILTPPALQYFMPGLLTAALDVDGLPELAETVHFALTPLADEDASVAQWKTDAKAAFTADERATIDRVLAYLEQRLED